MVDAGDRTDFCKLGVVNHDRLFAQNHKQLTALDRP
jgi:hypothetical protein